MKYLNRWKVVVQVGAAALAVLTLSSCLDKLKQFMAKNPPKTLTEEEVTKAETSDLFGPAKEETPVPTAPPFEINKSSMVSILCYHNFAPMAPAKPNDMIIQQSVFRQEMQSLRDAAVPVISMSDLLAWKRGEKNIPDECVVITMDDGWLGVYQVAFPILKEFGYPFTFFLYKNYVNRGGKSMTLAQIKEMIAYGAEVGSHSVSHRDLRNKKGMPDEQYKQWLNSEIVDSKQFIEATFGVKCRVFAYPYGGKNPDIVQRCMDAGYEAGVTVNPTKVTFDTQNGLLPRFVQLGDKDVNFKLAMSFHGRNDVANSKFLKIDAKDDQGQQLLELKPAPNSTVSDRLPTIEANLSKLGTIVPDSVALRVSGFGAVPVEFDETDETVRFQVPQRLRLDECAATLSFKRTDADRDEVITWKFKVNQSAAYGVPDTKPAGEAGKLSSPPANGGPQPPANPPKTAAN